MKTRDELNALRKEVETLAEKFAELTDDELKQVTGGNDHINNETGLLILEGSPLSKHVEGSGKTELIP